MDTSDALVGRTAELTELTAAVDRVAAGQGGVLLVSGEPGMGKTRLVAELASMGTTRLVAELLGRQELPVLRGRAVPDEGAPPLWPWLQALRGRPERAALPSGDGDLPVTAARGAQWQAFEAVLDGLASGAPGAGLVIVLEDLHWADESTLRLLCQGAGRPGLLFVVTYRSTEQPAPLRAAVTELRRLDGTRALGLRPWSAADVADWVADRADPSWVPVLHRAAAGNPLIVRELLAALVDAGAAGQSAPADGSWPLGVPEQLAGITADRMARLGEGARMSVQACAVLGAESTAGEVALLCELPAEDAVAGLEEAIGAGLLAVVERIPLRVSFVHDLVRGAVYEALPAARRLVWHARVAEAVEDGRLAREPVTHRLRAAIDEPSRAAAVRSCRAAAAAATDQLAFDRAVELLDAALALPGLSPDLRCELMLDAADAEYVAGLAGAAVIRCREAASRTERADLLVRAALVVRGIYNATVSVILVGLCERAMAALPPDADADRARVLAQRALALGHTVDPAEVDATSREALRLAERSGCRLALSDALRARQDAVSGLAGVDERLELANRMLDVADTGASPDVELWGRLWRTDAAFQLGAIGMLDAELVRLGMLADRLGWPIVRWHLHRLRAARALFAGRFADVDVELEQGRRVAEQTQDPVLSMILRAVDLEHHCLVGRLADDVEHMRWGLENAPMPVIWADMGRLLLRAGDPDSAQAGFERVRPILAAHPVEGTWPGMVRATGELAVAFAELDVVDWCYQAMLPFAHYHEAGGSGSVYCRGSLSGPLGQWAAALGRLDDAERHLTEAIGMNDRAGALPYRTLSEVTLAEVLIAQGGMDGLAKAAELAKRAAATARRLGMAPTLAAADELLVTIRNAQRTALPLTAREREILGLLAAGRSNRQMATALVLSERTVESHVANVLGKLGVANRAQAAAWAVANGFPSAL